MGCWLSDRVVPWLKQNETLVANAIQLFQGRRLVLGVLKLEVGAWGHPGNIHGVELCSLVALSGLSVPSFLLRYITSQRGAS